MFIVLGNEDIDLSALAGDGNSTTERPVQLCESSVGLHSLYGSVGKEISECSASEKNTADKSIQFILPAILLLALSEILQGVAGAPIWTVGMAYIDNNSNPSLSAKLLGMSTLTSY